MFKVYIFLYFNISYISQSDLLPEPATKRLKTAQTLMHQYDSKKGQN